MKAEDLIGKPVALVAVCAMASLSAACVDTAARTAGPALATPAVATAQVTAPAVPVSGRSGARWRRLASPSSRVRFADSGPVETRPAPAPSELRSPDRRDDAHEGPAPTIQDLVSRHARENGVPEKLASAVVGIESRFNPSARGRGVLGLMQLNVQTARSVGFSGDPRGLLSPDTNLRYGMKVLADAYRSSKGDVCMTLAKYQSGHLTTRISAANRAYCARARALMAKA